MGILWHMKTIQITFIHVNGADIHKRTIQQWHRRRFLTVNVKNPKKFIIWFAPEAVTKNHSCIDQISQGVCVGF